MSTTSWYVWLLVPLPTRETPAGPSLQVKALATVAPFDQLSEETFELEPEGRAFR